MSGISSGATAGMNLQKEWSMSTNACRHGIGSVLCNSCEWEPEEKLGKKASAAARILDSERSVRYCWCLVTDFRAHWMTSLCRYRAATAVPVWLGKWCPEAVKLWVHQTTVEWKLHRASAWKIVAVVLRR